MFSHTKQKVDGNAKSHDYLNKVSIAIVFIFHVFECVEDILVVAVLVSL